jgi:hypothetical protein
VSSQTTGQVPTSMMMFLTRIETEYKKLPRYYPNVQNDTVYDNAKAKEQALQKAFENIREEFGSFGIVNISSVGTTRNFIVHNL